jgi:pilus assembly protein CpaC
MSLFAITSLKAQDQLIKVTKGKSEVVKYHEKIKAVSLADQEIADVVSITPSALVIIGKAEGVTSLIVWGESEELRSYEIEVGRNTTGQQVILEVQVAEVNRTALTEYGLDFLIYDDNDDHLADGTKILGSYAGSVTTPDPLSQKLFAQDGISGVARYLGNGMEISAVVKAMKKNGDIKLLANPRLLCLSGEKATFLVGGEIPVPVAQTIGASGVPTITIEWKQYGIVLNFLPTVVDTTLINLRINPEVSSLDYSNAVSYAGYDIPALRKRTADAIVEMNSGQSVLMGGLLARESYEIVNKFPLLGDIPILGFFFRHKETSETESELLIIVSPRIVTSIADEIIPPLPFDEELQSVAPADDQTEPPPPEEANQPAQPETEAGTEVDSTGHIIENQGD